MGDANPAVAGQELELELEGELEGELELVKESAPENGAPTAQDQPRPSPFAFSGLHFTVSNKQDRCLFDAFPWGDRQAEYRKADSWLEANPARRPKKNSSRFLHNWFAKIPAPPNGVKGVTRAEQRTLNNLKAAGFVC
jgi:hypothetical protein